MDPIATKQPYQPPPRPIESKLEEKKPKSDGPTGNPVMDAVAPPPTPTEKQSLGNFALKRNGPPPKQDAPVDRKPIGHVLIEKLTPKQTFQDKLDEARRTSNPNATIGPIAVNMPVSEQAKAEIKATECKGLAHALEALPGVGVPLAEAIKDACHAEPKAPKSVGALPNVPVTPPPKSTSSLPNTSKEGGDQPWTPITSK